MRMATGNVPGGSLQAQSVEGTDLLGHPSEGLGAGTPAGVSGGGPAPSLLGCMVRDPLSCRVALSPREGLSRVPLRGIFQGAMVVRGPDWEWGSQDGEWGPAWEGGGWAGTGCDLASWPGLSLPVGSLSPQEAKGSQVAWWTFVAGMWRQAGAWPA